MLAKLDMKIDSKIKLSYSMSSLFHGALMGVIDTDYAGELHIRSFNPYSQHLELRDGCWHWVVCTIDEEAYKKIIEVLLELDSIFIDKKDANIVISEKILTKKRKEDIESFFGNENDNYINISFLTSTCFKQNGKYMFMPDLRCIYQSLMNKYDVTCSNESFFDDEVLEQLVNYSQIKKYNIRTANFHLEGIKITGMVGDIQIKINGPRTMINFANMLFKLGEFSGIGAKCSLGMGAISLR